MTALPELSFSVFQRLQPAEYQKRFLAQHVRPDGRGLDEARPTALTMGAISTADGSALVRMGGTTVVVGIKAEVGVPPMDRDNVGWIVPNLELAPICHPSARPGPPSTFAQVCSHRLYEILINENAPVIDLKDLCVEQGKACWVLHIDAVCLALDGSVLDAALLGMVAALKNLRLPEVIYDDETVTVANPEDGQEEPPKTALNLHHLPLSSSFAIIPAEDTRTSSASSPHMLLDPTTDEEELTEQRLWVVLDAKSEELLCIQRLAGWVEGADARCTGTGGTVSMDVIKKAISQAKERATYLQALLGDF
ncbi:hypothetical protein BZG36_01143 [Bifiguratus adelaidae]|uniref:Ribosomal RNA-processing protein 43 n=1 Tax=Bifiguratus adelaidae TaxID=1938954 RepID=A0A261Y621_9FUNG|nr:hypothetical protein BZG36_01143 [Bifiguratus adelaidae]